MKKFIIAVIAVFVLIGSSVTSMLVGASRVSRYYRESDDHLRNVVVNEAEVIAAPAGENAQEIRLSPYNTSAFLTAVTRSGLLHRYWIPRGKERVVVTFADGAVYTVADGGEDKDGHDIAYIIYQYNRHTYCFSLTGYETFQRVSQCVAPEGFGAPNEETAPDSAA